MTDRQRNKYTRYAWAGGTFFPVLLLCQFFVLVGNRFWFYILAYVTQQIILRTNIFLIVVEVLAMFFGGLLRWSNYNLNKPVPAKSELPPKTICRKIMWSQFPPNLSCLQNNPPENKRNPIRIFFNLRKFLLGFFITQKQWDPNFLLLCISFLLCMAFLKNIENLLCK